MESCFRPSATNTWCSFRKRRRRSWLHSKRESWRTPVRSISSKAKKKFWRSFRILVRPKVSSASWCPEIFSTFPRTVGTLSSRCRQVFQSVFGSNKVVRRDFYSCLFSNKDDSFYRFGLIPNITLYVLKWELIQGCPWADRAGRLTLSLDFLQLFLLSSNCYVIHCHLKISQW